MVQSHQWFMIKICDQAENLDWRRSLSSLDTRGSDTLNYFVC